MSHMPNLLQGPLIKDTSMIFFMEMDCKIGLRISYVFAMVSRCYL